jgi:hypothetical protein
MALQDRTVTITVNTVGNSGLLADQMPSGYTDYTGGGGGGGGGAAPVAPPPPVVGNGPQGVNININAGGYSQVDALKLGQQIAGAIQGRR